MYNEFIGGDLQLPLQGVLFVNALYPGRCPRLWKSCPFGAQYAQCCNRLCHLPKQEC